MSNQLQKLQLKLKTNSQRVDLVTIYHFYHFLHGFLLDIFKQAKSKKHRLYDYLAKFKFLADYNTIWIKLTIMGSQTSHSTINVLNENFTNSNTLQTRYYKQVFSQHKMSSLRFKQKLMSIRKRSTYLQYAWARELQQFIKLSNKDKLYLQYQSTLKENCIREGRKEKLFCPINFKKSFLKELNEKALEFLKNMSKQGLHSIFEECKAYLMVQWWLHQLVTVQKDIQNQNYNEVKQVGLCCQSKQIYETLLILAQNYYKQLFKLQRAKQIVKIQDTSIKNYIASLQFTRGFHQRQLIIINLVKALQADQENSIYSFIGVCQAIGKSNVAAHLLLIQEIGVYQAFSTEKYLKMCLNEGLSHKLSEAHQSIN